MKFVTLDTFTGEIYIETRKLGEALPNTYWIKSPRITKKALSSFLNQPSTVSLHQLINTAETAYQKREALGDLWLNLQYWVETVINGKRF